MGEKEGGEIDRNAAYRRQKRFGNESSPCVKLCVWRQKKRKKLRKVRNIDQKVEGGGGRVF